jgi:superfamily I DNA and/or RNA helicase
MLKSIQIEWFQRFGSGPEFEPVLMSIADVVAGTCVGIASAGRISETDFDLVIIDEASKATPTEALVAMARGKQWVLVGDKRQLPPFIDQRLFKDSFLQQYDLIKGDLETTLFDRLLEGLQKECKYALLSQYRMVPPIGNLISECFYDGKLKSERLDSFSPVLMKCLRRQVTWYSTSNLARKKETVSPNVKSDGESFMNFEEVNKIQDWLTRLENNCRDELIPFSVSVITGYIAQKNLLFREISPTDEQKWQMLRIEINTVDAFQGRESDVLVYSITRSNDKGDLGFLIFEPRLNVALSRGRDALVIFGDANHCINSGNYDNPFKKVLKFIEDK